MKLKGVPPPGKGILPRHQKRASAKGTKGLPQKGKGRGRGAKLDQGHSRKSAGERRIGGSGEGVREQVMERIRTIERRNRSSVATNASSVRRRGEGFDAVGRIQSTKGKRFNDSAGISRSYKKKWNISFTPRAENDQLPGHRKGVMKKVTEKLFVKKGIPKSKKKNPEGNI